MEIIAGTVDTFSADVLFDMARYRHEVSSRSWGGSSIRAAGWNSTNSTGRTPSI